MNSCLPGWSYPLFAHVVVGVGDIVLAVGVGGGGGHCHGGGGGGGDIRSVLGAHVVVSASLGAVGFSTVLAQKHRPVIVRELTSGAGSPSDWKIG